MKASLNFFGFVVDDVAETTRYYTDVLGLTVNAEASIPNYYSQFVTQDGAIFAVFAAFGDGPDIAQRFDAALEVEDVDATFADWKAKGVDIVTDVQDLPFGRTFLARTPNNHILRVMNFTR